ncbi:hypothetical protein C8N46_11094 [Kordia periserrulae]|uniref:Uncharacterized protein n=1 Tax=Kordia periserrulae TaxID=701523 RepID=A0A2T6BTG5_9FLAO|nr:hypothetical protein C8N46_11094 [Kordia periserrulae]
MRHRIMFSVTHKSNYEKQTTNNEQPATKNPIPPKQMFHKTLLSVLSFS